MQVKVNATFRRWLERLVLAAFVAAVLAAVGFTVQNVHASNGPCFNDECAAGSDAFCRDLGCDFCSGAGICEIDPG